MRLQGTYCTKNVPDDAEALDLMVYKGEQETLVPGKPSTSPLRDTIISIFKTYGLPVIVLLWLVVVTDIVVMVSTILICRAVAYQKRGSEEE